MWIFPKIFVSHPSLAPFMNFILFSNVSTRLLRTSVAYADRYFFWYIYYVLYSAFYAYIQQLGQCHILDSCSIRFQTCHYFVLGCCKLEFLLVGLLYYLLQRHPSVIASKCVCSFFSARLHVIWRCLCVCGFSVHIFYGFRVFLDSNLGCPFCLWFV